MAEKLIQEIGDTCIFESQNQFCVTHKGQVVVPYGKYAWIDKFDNGLARFNILGAFVTNYLKPETFKQQNGIPSETPFLGDDIPPQGCGGY